MSGPLDGVNAKLDRAEKHFKTAKAMVDAYFAQDFDPVTVDFNTEKEVWYGLQVIPTPDIQIQAVVGDCIHNLRSALDHLANRLVELYGGEPTKETAFPALKVAPTATKAGQSRLPHIAGLDQTKAGQVLTIINNQQPYTFGEDFESHPLWILNELWLQDKHRSLIQSPIWMLNTEFHISVGMDGWTPAIFTGVFRKRTVSNEGAVFDFIPDDENVDVNGEATLAIAIGKGLPCKGQPVVTVLENLGRYVRDHLVVPLSGFF